MKVLFLIFFISYSLPFTAFGANKQTNTIKVLNKQYDRESYIIGSCIRGYVCEALHNLGSSGETLIEVGDRIGAEVLKEIYNEGG